MTTAPSHIAHEHELLEAARAGDQDGYRRLVEPYRRELQAHCYRMLGSAHDADDALQDALLRAWRGLPRFQGRSSLRTWLYRITTNVCLAQAGRRTRLVMPVDYGPGTEAERTGRLPAGTDWIEPLPDGRLGPDVGLASPAARYERLESVELAFLAAFQHLPPTQRAVLLLRDVLGFSAREVAGTLDKTVASVNSAHQRARATLRDRLPERSQQANLRALGDARLQKLIDAYVAAWERGDAAAILAMLTEDATVSMPPALCQVQGREAIADTVLTRALSRRWRMVPVRANGQLALGCFGWSPETGRYEPHSLDVLTLDGDRVADVIGFVMPELLPAFGLPPYLPA